jgi:hypothetical protein
VDLVFTLFTRFVYSRDEREETKITLTPSRHVKIENSVLSSSFSLLITSVKPDSFTKKAYLVRDKPKTIRFETFVIYDISLNRAYFATCTNSGGFVEFTLYDC